MRISDWSSDVCSSDLQAAIGCRLDASRFCLVDLAADGIAILRPARDKLAIEIQLVFIRIAAIERATQIQMPGVLHRWIDDWRVERSNLFAFQWSGLLRLDRKSTRLNSSH